ncbi:glycoside hydrolase family 15 protein [Methylopila sp. 73B]|uniref:glycoside hydrolase family 15 protein n=1 Tax=Methylopila sp. 73B TaxID=1120792 RepID=UPI0003754914|nr:glycoside hydrolase family 15 protein [Methylopila sp. 73B]
MAEADAPACAIEDHALIGDMATAALVSREGSIDFLCWPRFDSPSVFAGLLDPAKGGHFTIRPKLAGAATRQLYLPDTNVVVTRWLSHDGSAELTDGMRPVCGEDGGGPQILRRVEATRGEVTFSVACRPRFDYARARGETRRGKHGVSFRFGELTLRLASDIPLRVRGGDAVAEFTLKKGEVAWFVLDGGEHEPLSADQAQLSLDEAVAWWRRWVAQSTYEGRWRETVTRSALALKLMTSRDFGSIVAAPTFGLPEAIGFGRNWDYRATWVRDASFTVYAFMRLGFRKEALAFVRWIAERVQGEKDGVIRLMYALDGGPAPAEEELPHLAGYRGSQPVRIGNAAASQSQLDIYGELLDAVYLNDKYGQAMSADGWTRTRRIVDHACAVWRDKDAGIWEMRGEPRAFLHSRLMCWVAVDRALRLALKRSLPGPVADWTAARDAIHDDIWNTFYDAERGHFVASAEGDALDGALLLMPLVRFCSATDPKWLATLDAIKRDLGDDSMIFRYRCDDGLEGDEGAFSACSFWYVECLARAGRLDEAQLCFSSLLAYRNHVGLYAEEIGLDGCALGNFPQALTHLALISAAHFLDRELSGRRSTWRP